MSISGMTGFARVEGATGAQRWIWELRSVNGRGLDLKLKLPPGFDGMEVSLRAAAAQRFKRGSLQASLTLAREGGEAATLRIDAALLRRLIEAGEPYLAEKRVRKPTWDGLLALRGVVVSDEAGRDEAAQASLEAALFEAFSHALDNLARARANEGRMLAAALSELASRAGALVAAARGSAAAAPEAALARIRQRLEALTPDVKFDPARLAQEAAIVALKADVQEELERLDAHVGELRALLVKPEPVGRSLDFLAQELTREANTLCSKSADIELTRLGLDLKAVVDQIKEQAANVE